tara:strand:+ start:330 stop:452 length:123 start_codon:yes stop_codon:yes gene_type:complete
MIIKQGGIVENTGRESRLAVGQTQRDSDEVVKTWPTVEDL